MRKQLCRGGRLLFVSALFFVSALLVGWALSAPVRPVLAADAGTARLVEAGPVLDISTVFEVHFFFDYEATEGNVNTTAEQEELVELNGRSIAELRRVYDSVWFYCNWRAEKDGTGKLKRILVVSVDKMHPFGYRYGENTLTAKEGLVTPDGRTVAADCSVTFDSPTHYAAAVGAHVLEQDSLGIRYLAVEFDVPKSFAWSDSPAITPALAGFVFVNGRRLNTIENYQKLVGMQWEWAAVYNGGTKTHLDLSFIGDPKEETGLLKTGENLITVKKGMQINWPGVEIFKNRFVDRDYTFVYTVVPGAENDTAAQKAELAPDWSQIELPEETELATTLDLPATLPDGEREIPIRWSATTAGRLGDWRIVGSVSYDFGESVADSSRFCVYTVRVVKRKIDLEDIVFPTQASVLFYGQSLAECVMIGDVTAYGVFDFVDPQAVLPVGKHEVTIRFYPVNERDFTYELGSLPLESKISVTVKKNHVPLLPLPDFADKLYRAGTALETIALPAGMAWEEPAKQLSHGENRCRVVCTADGEDRENYEPIVRYVTLWAERPDGEEEGTDPSAKGGCSGGRTAAVGLLCALAAAALKKELL